MKRNSIIFSFALTLLISVILLTLGYNTLAKAGEQILDSSADITKLNTTNPNTYMFFSQADEDIELYPWNHYADSVSIEGYFGEGWVIDKFINTENLYSNLTYYFYKAIPYDKSKYMYDNKLSLASLIDYENLSTKCTVCNTDYLLVYYYTNSININGTNYDINFTFDELSNILSFNVKQQLGEIDSNTYALAKSYISRISKSSSSNNYLDLFYSDMMNKDNYFDNYTISINKENNKSSISFFYSDNSEYSMFAKDFDDEGQTNIDIEEKSTENTNNKSSYQLIETKDELLIVLLDNNSVLHFDPVNLIFTGFNSTE